MTRVLAIGIDAAEPSLVRAMIDAGELPAMRALLARGTWSRVESPAHIGSGAVWPSFITGRPAREHGIHSEWCWSPESMSLQRYSSARLTPQWRSFAGSLGLIDVPFAPFNGVARGFEISEWGAHDQLEGETRGTIGPLPEHSFANRGVGGVKARGALAASLIGGVDAAIVVFTEVHHASHEAWPDVREVIREVDRQIGMLGQIAGDGAAVLVFSLHGMRPALQVPEFLEQLLIDAGFARRAGWSPRTLFAAAKRHAPPPLKKLYHRWTPAKTMHRLAQPTMLPAYDWNRTRAFSLPSDQHGWIRVNLAGREARGIVALDQYEPLCHELETLLRSHPLVDEVWRSGRTQFLPDLVIHWTPPHSPTTSRKVLTGQHSRDGFLLGRGVRVAANIYAEEIYGLIAAAASEPEPRPD